MITPDVVLRFLTFNARDPRLLGRIAGIFLRGLVGLVGVAAVLSVLVGAGTWLVAHLEQVRQRRVGTVKPPRRT